MVYKELIISKSSTSNRMDKVDINTEVSDLILSTIQKVKIFLEKLLFFVLFFLIVSLLAGVITLVTNSFNICLLLLKTNLNCYVCCL